MIRKTSQINRNKRETYRTLSWKWRNNLWFVSRRIYSKIYVEFPILYILRTNFLLLLFDLDMYTLKTQFNQLAVLAILVIMAIFCVATSPVDNKIQK